METITVSNANREVLRQVALLLDVLFRTYHVEAGLQRHAAWSIRALAEEAVDNFRSSTKRDVETLADLADDLEDISSHPGVAVSDGTTSRRS